MGLGSVWGNEGHTVGTSASKFDGKMRTHIHADGKPEQDDAPEGGHETCDADDENDAHILAANVAAGTT